MIAETYLRTNHHLASRRSSKESIAGKFNAGDDILTTRDPDLHFRMDAKAAGFYETAVFWQPPNQKTRSERTDFATGSGEKGQTYLYWRGNQLFQLPVSYWMEFHAWVNSPGFIDGTADFEQPIVPRCLECHATYFAPVSSATAGNVYRKNGDVLGISCERCHGAGREHVERERACDKGEKSPQRLKPSCDASDNGTTEVVPSQIVPSKLGTRRRCRGSGKWKSVRNATEESGSRLGRRFLTFRGSRWRTTFACSGPMPTLLWTFTAIRWRRRKGVAATRIRRCAARCAMKCTRPKARRPLIRKSLKCHKESECGEFAKLGAKIRDNCIDCHMPVQESNLIISNLNRKQIKARMRNHWIKVYSAPGN
jgi:hypothetical protein